VQPSALGATALALCADGTLALLRGGAEDEAEEEERAQRGRNSASASVSASRLPLRRLALRGGGGAPRRVAAAEWAPDAAAAPGSGGALGSGGLLLAQAGASGRILFTRLPRRGAPDGETVWLLGAHPGAATRCDDACVDACVAAKAR
jgi:hypothetical protein